MTPADRPEPLRADSRRQAISSIRGYAYQLWSSVHAWLELLDDQILFLERAEDFDVARVGETTAVQVKTSASPITLRSRDIVAAANNFWKLRTANAARVISLRFLTTARFGIEQGQPFGENIAGLDLWNRSRSDASLIPELAAFLTTLPEVDRSLAVFLSECDDHERIRVELIQPITWVTRARGLRYVKEAVRRKLVSLGDSREVRPSEAAAVADRLFAEVVSSITDTADRSLDRARLLMVFEDATTTRVPSGELHRLRTIATRVADGSIAPDSLPPAHFATGTARALSVPPLLETADSRPEVVARLRTHLANRGVINDN